VNNPVPVGIYFSAIKDKNRLGNKIRYEDSVNKNVLMPFLNKVLHGTFKRGY
jgi:hypothetical protein